MGAAGRSLKDLQGGGVVSADNTRDIAVAAKSEIAHLTKVVEQLSRDVRSLCDEMNERRGIERAAKWVVGLGSGVTGAAIVKFGGWLGGVPLK